MSVVLAVEIAMQQILAVFVAGFAVGTLANLAINYVLKEKR